MTNRKAQVELVAVLGIIAVITVVAFYVYTTGTEFPSVLPQGVSQEQKVVLDSLTAEAKKGADLAIRWLEMQGGYITPDPADSTIFNMVAVPYWGKCSVAGAPTMTQLTERLETAVKNYLKNSLSGRTEYAGRAVDFSLNAMSVRANILDNKIDFSVNIQATLAGQKLQGPITFSVPTKMGEIHDFGKKLAEQAAATRMFEEYTISTIYFSGRLETQGALSRCGQSIYQSGSQISRGLEDAIRYTLSNTIFWEPMPAVSTAVGASGGTAGQSKTFAIETVGGKRYPQLGIGLYLPDNFALPPSNPLSVSNNEMVAAGFIFAIPVCVTFYDWKYSTGYPLVVSVLDDLTGNRFNFAIQVDIDSMRPGSCAAAAAGGGGIPGSGAIARVVVAGGSVQSIGVANGGSGYGQNPRVLIFGSGSGAKAEVALVEGGVIKRIDVTEPGTGYDSKTYAVIYDGGDGGSAACDASEMACTSDITVTNSATPPVPLAGVFANYNGCPLGETDNNGRLQQPSPCGSGKLALSKEGYSYQLSDADLAAPAGAFVLTRIPEVTVNFSFIGIKEEEDGWGTSEPSPNNHLSSLKYYKCTVSPADDIALLYFKSATTEYPVTNYDSESEFVPADHSNDADCQECASTSDSDACSSCAIKYANQMPYTSLARVDYLPVGSYTVDGQGVFSTTSGTHYIRGGFFVETPKWSIPEQNSKINVYMPKGSDATRESKRRALTATLKADCGMDPLTSGTSWYGSSIKMAPMYSGSTACSCSQLRAMMAAELGSCQSADVGALFRVYNPTPINPANARWECTLADVKAAVASCGYELKGC